MAQSENQLTHREAQEGQSLEQEVGELQSMTMKVVLDQDARYEELRSSGDGLIQTQREETDPAMRETSQLTVKPRLSSRGSVTITPTRTFGGWCTWRVPR